MSDDNRPVRVDFPKEMKVNSPKIDAIAKATETIVEISTNNFKHVVAALQSLTKLPDLVSQLQTTFVEQFKNLFTTTIEADVMNRQANIKVLKNKVEFIEGHVEKKERHAKETVDRKTSRYKELSGKISAEHQKFLKRLDSNAYDIVDKIYSGQVQEKFSFDSLPNINYLTTHASESAFVRTICLNESWEEARNSVERFREERSLFYGKLSDHSTKRLEEGHYGLPFYFVETENMESGETETELFFPWQVEGESVDLMMETRDTLHEMAAHQIESNKVVELNNGSLEGIMNHLKSNDLIPEEELQRFSSDIGSNNKEEE